MNRNGNGNGNGVHDAAADEIHDLLRYALADVSRPAGVSAGELITRARRGQRRRRALAAVAAAGAVAVVVAVTALTSAGVSRSVGTGSGPGPAPVSPTPSVSRAAGTTPAQRVRGLLPPTAGEVAKASTPTESVGGRTVPQSSSPLNGRYTLSSSSGVGYLEVDVQDRPVAVLRQEITCAGNVYYGCTDDQLGDGSTLLTRVIPAHHGTGLGYEALLIRADGHSVDLIASSGNPAYGRLLSAPPFTRAQLTALVEEEGWLAGAADPMG